MCGKFTQMMSWRTYHTLASIIGNSEPSGVTETVTPMRFASVVILGDSGERATKMMRWGLAERGSSSPGNTPKHIHAQSEKLHTAWRYLSGHRGILVVKTFNEGKEITPSKTEQHVVTPNDGKPMAIAVLYEHWQRAGDDLYTFVMMTTETNSAVRPVVGDKGRMPAVLRDEDWPMWLGEVPATLDELRAILATREYDWKTEPEKTQPPPAKPSKPQNEDDQPTLF